MVQLSEELVAALDAESTRRGCSRSGLIREAVIEHLARTSLAADIERYVASYRDVPQAEPDQWGPIDGHVDEATSKMLRSLDADEEAHGSTW